MFKRKDENLSMLADFYEFTMGNGYLKKGMEDTICYFDMYYRQNPDDAAFSIVAGLRSFIQYIEDLHFTEEDLDYLRSRNMFDEAFLDYLRDFKFECDIWAIPEGSVVFPNEPLVTVRGPIIQVSLIETMLLLTINHQSMIATKTNRIVRAAEGRSVMEFGSRRAQGPDAATQGAVAAYIGGAIGTANTLSDSGYGVPALGTMAHSWVMMFDSEYEAFKAYAETYPDNCTLLVDTYDTLASGVPNAIKVFDEVLKPKGYRPAGIRLDSGDIAYLSKKARKMLDQAGYEDVIIVASNSLDEHKIQDIIQQGAQVDSFGVGENLITSKSNPVFGGVYKLVAIEDGDTIIPKIKISENVEKITTPGFKSVFRLYDNKSKMAVADVITTHDEKIDDSKPYEIFHPTYTWKRMVLTDFTAKAMMKRIYDKGDLVYEIPSLDESRKHCEEELETIWAEYRRFDNPALYKVDLSKKLWDIKHQLMIETNADVSNIVESKN